MPASRTRSLRDETRDGVRTADPCLVLALACEHPHERPWRMSLAGIDEVVIGRGPARSVDRRDGTLIVAIPDTSVSSIHARVRRAAGEWIVEDAQSKNGTFVNEEKTQRATFGEADVLEVGTTFFFLRRGGGDVGAADWEQRPAGMRTLCESLAAAFGVLARVTTSAMPIMLLGETGTGKEMVARAIHKLSQRPGPFTAINCGGLPETLMASELFGAKKGAFSGAVDRTGLVEASHRGTLFLDEIAELPQASQAVLLRVLQQHEVTPLGATRAIPVDIRVITATHEDLAQHVATRRFRKDLYARVRGFALTLPPLRTRREDIGLLVAELLPRVGGAACALSRMAARALFAYDWPLNVRELEHALAAAVAVADGGAITLAHLPEDIRAAVTATESLPAMRERERFVSLAREHQGNVSAIARALGTSRAQVRRLAERYAVDLEAVRP